MEEHEAAYHTAAGASICASFFAGGKFTMARHHLQAEEKQEYVLQRVAHRASDYTYITADAGPPSYDNTFEAFPAATQFRPAGRTPWPTVHGPQTATVVGPPGEIIHTDKHGRVKLQFHWDRRGKRDDKSSCWVRVSQNWAGKGWGGVFIPHVGQEVIVSYQEGDPDMPLVTGRVYNGENTKSLNLPDEKTKSAIRDHGGNRIVMEGKKGSEDFVSIATKDKNTTVGNNYNLKVNSARTTTISTDDTETVGGSQSVTVGAKRSVSVGSSSSEKVSADREVIVGAAHKHSVAAKEDWIVGGSRKMSVTGSNEEAIGGALKITVSGATTLSDSGGVEITSAQKITLSVGGSSITISSSGITLTCSGQIQLQAATIEHNT
jgi:type VI secretion system secreted protein VgrG